MDNNLHLFKDIKLRDYSLEKSNSSISNVLNVQTFIKNYYYLKILKSVSGTLVSIFNIYFFHKKRANPSDIFSYILLKIIVIYYIKNYKKLIL
jgi:hypothetical protein